MTSSGQHDDSIVRFLHLLGYENDLLARDFPVWTGQRVIDVEVVAFGQQPADMRSSTILGSRVNGASREDILDAARALACPAAVIGNRDEYELWAVGGTSGAATERVATTSVAGLAPLADEYRQSLRSEALLAAKQTGRQMTLFPVDIELLDRARSSTGQSLATLVEAAMSTVLQALPADATPNEREVAWRHASMLTVSAMAALVVRDKFQLEARGYDIFRAANERFPTQFTAPDSAAFHGAEFLLTQLISLLGENVNYRGLDPSVVSHVYEDAVVHRALKLELGIYYTPPGLADRLTKAVPFEEISPEERSILDPTCGSGTLLLAGHDRLSALAPARWDPRRRNSLLETQILGFDKDPFAAELARLSMFIHSLPDGPRWSVRVQDSLELSLRDSDRPSVVLANPPWGDRRRPGEHREQHANEFIDWALRNVRPGGFVGLILPVSWLASVSSRSSRRAMREHADVFEVWRLPEGVFGSGAMAPAIVLAQAKLPTRKTWLYKRVIDGESWSRFLKDGVADTAIVAASQQVAEAPFLASAFDAWFSAGTIASVLGERAHVYSSPVPLPPADERGGSGSFRWLRYFGRVPAYGRVKLEHTIAVEYPDDFSRRGLGLATVLRAAKVVISGKRAAQSPWRLKVALDELGVIPRESANFVVPNDNTAEERFAILSLMASRFASAWIDANAPFMAISPEILNSLPIPTSTESWQALATLGQELVARVDSGDGSRTSRQICREIDEVVETNINLPADTRHQLDRLFAGRPSPDGSVRYDDVGTEQPVYTSSISQFGAVLESRPGSLLLWVPGITPTNGQWMSAPNRFLGWHCVAGATFDVAGPLEDLNQALFSFQRLSYQVAEGESGLPALEPTP